MFFNKLLLWISLPLAFIFCSCGDETNKIIGTWQRSVEHNDIKYTETYQFSGKNDGYKMTYSFIPSNDTSVGYIVDGTWQPVGKNNIKIFQDAATICPAYRFSDPDRDLNIEISDYLSSLQRIINKQNSEMNYGYISVKVQKNEITLTTRNNSNIFEKLNNQSDYTNLLSLKKPIPEQADTRYPDYDWLSYRDASYSDVSGKDKDELRIMRNYIYARHGYMFKSNDLQEYFSNYPWYEPRYSNVNSMLNNTELNNIRFIQSYE